MMSSVIQRFWAKTVQQGSCLVWTGAQKIGRDGSRLYGLFNDGQKMVQAHRFIYERCVEPLGNHILMHSCDIPSCIALQHLSPGTQAQNVADCIAKGRSHGPPRKTHCSKGHLLDESNTYLRRNGSRGCLICRRTHRKTYRTRHG